MEYSRALTTLWIALGGAAGTVMRYWVGILLSRWSYTLPWGTIIINITGSFAIAFFGAATLAGGRFPASDVVRLVFMVGICGGYTTFSSFSLQTLDLLRNGAPGRAVINIGLSVFLCILAAAIGFWSAEAMTRNVPDPTPIPASNAENLPR